MIDTPAQTLETLRCAKCHRRLANSELQCAGCGWTIDPALAREAALLHQRKRHKKHRKHKAARLAIRLALLLLALLALVTAIYVVLDTVNESAK
ncbi:MAG TPA: hypothetical protein VKX17_09805 [Planctomycetota bacterium]|nr:hypothetical protein [Planctomycetota bacterium]